MTSLGSAIASEYEKVQSQAERSHKIKDVIKAESIDKYGIEEPPRGSYQWWALIARENTGSSICDSGTIYGYKYSRPAPPEGAGEWLEVSQCMPESITMSTIGHLTNTTDASDGHAEAYEQLLHWYGNYVDPSSGWYSTLSEFLEGGFIMGVVNDGEDLDFVFGYIDDDVSEDEAQIEFPYCDYALLRGTDGFEIHHSDNTYNTENNLDQDFQYSAFSDDWCEYAFIQTHNGCDARGGYSTPMCASIEDEFYSITCDWLEECRDCCKRFIGYNLDNVDENEILDTVRSFTRRYVEIIQWASGQRFLPNMGLVEPKWESQSPFKSWPAIEQALERHIEEDERSPMVINASTCEVVECGTIYLGDALIYCSQCKDWK